MGRFWRRPANWAGLFEGRFVAVPLSQHVSALNIVWIDPAGMAACTLLLFFSMDSASALFGRTLLMQVYAENISLISRVSPNAAKVSVPVI